MKITCVNDRKRAALTGRYTAGCLFFRAYHTMLCVLLLVLTAAVGANAVRYTGAVLEYEPYSSWEAGGAAILRENARVFLEYARLASQQGADILVYPEYGLTSTNIEGGDVLSLAQVVPPPADIVVPCDANHTDQQHTQVHLAKL
ncbi:hypothetical protein GWK47_038440 [Chionoecetes opilio]|uniref:CN hydrolase domain-containing protein n=1 Tax=Chionoecetes opilio TaxID=41210 RepID=A0A8J5D1V7_CHIOP|nr:hypothetical protein GWK47_038440 [Chionoecetes opilio]